MKILLIFFLGTTALLTSCQKDTFEKTFIWKETGCSDPWKIKSGSTQSEVQAIVTNFLDEEGVKVNSFTFDKDFTNYTGCEACHCITGTIYIVEAPRRDSKKLKNLGFTEE